MIGVQQYMANTYHDEHNGDDEVTQRRIMLTDAMRDVIGDGPGLAGYEFSMWDVVKSRGLLTQNAGAGADGNPGEVWKAILWELLAAVLVYLNQRLAGIADEN